MCAVDWPAFFSVLKDLVLALAAIVTATVAWLGLQKWRKELRGKADFDVARGLARATYKLREEIQSARSPLMRVPATPPGTAADARGALEALESQYRARWDRVATALQEFDTQVLEAEALWGSGIQEAAEAVRMCATTLFVSIEAILDDRAAGGEHFDHDRPFGRRMRSNAHASRSDKDNELTKQVMAAVAGVETHLSPHLRRTD